MIGVSVSGGIRPGTASETLHIADDVLIGSKVGYLSNFSAALHFSECPLSAQLLRSPWLRRRSAHQPPAAFHGCRTRTPRLFLLQDSDQDAMHQLHARLVG